MKIQLVIIGKTDRIQLQTLIDDYSKRIGFYIPFETVLIPDLKNRKSLPERLQKKMEGDLILKKISPADHVVLLDEKGRHYTSEEFSDFFRMKMNAGLRNLVFVIGGPYGFSEEVYKRADEKLSLSKMTFSHQMIRLFFVEQVYRAFTILRNESYHHR